MSILFEDHLKTAYTAERFVNRDVLLTLVETKVGQGTQPPGIINYPLLNVWGAAGSGKTWLLQHLVTLYQRVPSQKSSCTAYVDLKQIDVSHPKKSERVVEQLAEQLLSQFNQPEHALYTERLHEVKIGQQLSVMVEVLNLLAEEHTPLLLFDHFDLADRPWWDQIEAELLEPLLTDGRLLIILASRRPLLSWLRPELLRRQEALRLTQLTPFSAADLQQQTAESAAPFTGWRYSGGNPWLAARLATAGESFTHTDLFTTYHSFKHVLLAAIPKNLVNFLEIVGVLRFFREAALSHMLKETGHMVPNKVKLGRILRQLAQYEDIVWWEKEQAHYVSNVTARILLTQLQLLRQPEQLLQTQRYAIEFYWQRLSNFDEKRAVPEIIYHQLWMMFAGQPPARQNELWEYVRALEAEQLREVRELVTADAELKSLTPADQYQMLVARFDKIATKPESE